MKTKYRKTALYGLTISISIFTINFVLIMKQKHLSIMPAWAWITLGLCATVIWIFGCRALAKGRGYSPWIMLVGGIPSCLGPAAILLMFTIPVVLLLAL